LRSVEKAPLREDVLVLGLCDQLSLFHDSLRSGLTRRSLSDALFTYLLLDVSY